MPAVMDAPVSPAPVIPWDVKAWQTSERVAAMPHLVRSLYREMIGAAYLAGGSLPDNPRVVQHLVVWIPDEGEPSFLELYEEVLRRGAFVRGADGRLHNRRVTRDLARRRAHAEPDELDLEIAAELEEFRETEDPTIDPARFVSAGSPASAPAILEPVSKPPAPRAEMALAAELKPEPAVSPAPAPARAPAPSPAAGSGRLAGPGSRPSAAEETPAKRRSRWRRDAARRAAAARWRERPSGCDLSEVVATTDGYDKSHRMYRSPGCDLSETTMATTTYDKSHPPSIHPSIHPGAKPPLSPPLTQSLPDPDGAKPRGAPPPSEGDRRSGDRGEDGAAPRTEGRGSAPDGRAAPAEGAPPRELGRLPPTLAALTREDLDDPEILDGVWLAWLAWRGDPPSPGTRHAIHAAAIDTLERAGVGRVHDPAGFFRARLRHPERLAGRWISEDADRAAERRVKQLPPYDELVAEGAAGGFPASPAVDAQPPPRKAGIEGGESPRSPSEPTRLEVQDEDETDWLARRRTKPPDWVGRSA